MKNLFLLLAILLSISDSLAQTSWCFTKAPTQTEKANLLQKIQAFESQRARMSIEGVKRVALKVHLLSLSHDRIEFSDSRINELVDTLNSHFTNAGIQFYLCNGVDYISSNNYASFDPYYEDAFCAKYDVNNAINLYLVRGFSDSNLGGYARFPTLEKESNRIFCTYSNPRDLITKILPHEMGHYFGLLHTFEGANLIGAEEYVTRGENANCSIRGDMLCDTPADPYTAVKYDIKNCTFISDAVDAYGEHYSPQLGNLMSYYRGCGNFFTPGQIDIIKTGLLIRLTPNRNTQSGYSLNCQSSITETLTTGDVYMNGLKLEPASNICVDTPFKVTFTTSGNFNKDTEYTAYIVSQNRTYSAAIGKSNAKEIICKIPKDAAAGDYYRIKIEASNPDVSGTLSDLFYYAIKRPDTEISGEYEVFEGENLKIPIKFLGGNMNYELDNRSETFNFYISNDPALNIVINKSEVIKIKRSWNECGEGINTGQAIVNVVPKPLAKTFRLENMSENYICQGKPMLINLLPDGSFEKDNSFNVWLSDSKGENFEEIAVENNGQNLLSIKVPDNLPTGSGYRLKVISTKPAIETTTANLSVYPNTLAILSGDTTIISGQQASLRIRFEGKPPFSFETSEGQTFTTNENSFKWMLTPTENNYFSLKSVSNICGNGQVQGAALVKVNHVIKTPLLKFSSICAGNQISIPFEIQGNNLTADKLLVQLSDSNGKNYKTINSSGNSSPLTVIIPENSTEGSNYHLRLISIDGLSIGNESNGFEIKTKPTALISEAILGNKGDTRPLTVKLTGGAPWAFSINTGDIPVNYEASQSPFSTPVVLTKSSIYQLQSVSNACGVGKVYGQTIVNAREQAVAYCIPTVFARNSLAQLSRFRLTDAEGKILISNYELKTGKDFYTDNTAMVAYVKPGNSYNFDIMASDFGTEEEKGDNYSVFLLMWVDYNQNGVFERNESILENASDLYKGTLTIPKDAKKGLTRIRIRATGSFLDLEEMTKDACAKSSLGGEIEDYTLYITDSAPAYSIQMDLTAPALCKAKEYTIPFTYTGEFSDNNIFRAALYNDFGQFITYVGESKTSPVTIKFPHDILIGHGYKLKMIASDFQYEGFFTKAFRINDFATATISGNQKAYVGEPVFISLALDGGGGWEYSVGQGGGLTLGYLPNKMNVEFPAFLLSPPKPGVYDIKVAYLYNEACYQGTGIGSARIEILAADKSARIYRTFSDLNDVVYQQCKATEKVVTFLTSGEFSKDNFFTCHLIGPDDKFVAAIGYSKTTKMLINIPKNIEGYGYKLKIVSSAPYSESLLSVAFTIAPIPKAELSGYSEIIPGEQGTIKLDLTGEAPWQLKMSDGNIITTNIPSQELKVSPSKTETYSILSVKDRMCNGEASGTATVKVMKKASAISLKQVSDICAGAITTLRFRADGAFKESNAFRILLSDKTHAILKEIDSRIINDSTLYLTIPSDVPSGEGYKLRVVSTNPYIESETSYAFIIKPASKASISSEAQTVYENSSVQLRVDFSGEGPFDFELSDGTPYKNIVQSPYFISIKATTGINKYSLKNVINSCGQGRVSGEVILNVMPLPVIKTEKLITEAVCIGQTFFIPFTISQGKFQSDNTFKVEIGDMTNNSFKEIKSITKGDSLFVITDQNITTGKYKIRVVSTSPVVVGATSVSDLVIKTLPKAKIDGGSTILAGDSAKYFLTFSGDSPYTARLSNGTELTNVMTDSLVVAYLPKESETITITSIKNACGEGSFSGKAFFEVYHILGKEELQPFDASENQVEIYPIPFEQSTSLYVAPSLLNQSAEFEISDILGRRLMKQPVSHLKTPIDLNFYPPGIYYVRVMINEKQFLRKILK